MYGRCADGPGRAMAVLGTVLLLAGVRHPAAGDADKPAAIAQQPAGRDPVDGGDLHRVGVLQPGCCLGQTGTVTVNDVFNDVGSARLTLAVVLLTLVDGGVANGSGVWWMGKVSFPDC